jgi:hypothetical protein
MKTFFSLLVEALLNWLWKLGLEAHKKQMQIKAQKESATRRADIVQHELNVYKDIVQEALESDIESEVVDEILIDAARGFLRRLDSLQGKTP